MTRWSDQLDGNPIHQTLRQLNEYLEADVQDIDADHEAEKRRLKKFLQNINEVIAGLDAEFYPEQQLIALNQQLIQPTLVNNLQAYKANPDRQYLHAANESLTAILPTIYQFTGFSRQPKVRDTIKLVEEAYDNFCKKIEQAEKSLQVQLGEADTKLNEVSRQVSDLTKIQADLKEKIDKTLIDWQSDYIAAQTKRIEEFSTAQIKRENNFETAVREWREASDQEITKISTRHNDDMDRFVSQYTTEVNVRLKDMKGKHDAILEIHGLVGTDGVAGGYQKGASEERRDANFWRWGSIISLALAAIWISVKYFSGLDLTPNGDVNWAEVVTATSLTLVLLGGAGYTARQSKLHRETEQHLRWFALEVKAIDPFLSSLPLEQQYELKNQLSQKLFGQNRLTADKSEANGDVVPIKLLEGLLQLLAKFQGK